MSFKQLTGKTLRLVYMLGKWTLGIFALAIFVSLAFSLFEQSQIRNSIEDGMTRGMHIADQAN